MCFFHLGAPASSATVEGALTASSVASQGSCFVDTAMASCASSTGRLVVASSALSLDEVRTFASMTLVACGAGDTLASDSSCVIGAYVAGGDRCLCRSTSHQRWSTYFDIFKIQGIRVLTC